MTLKIQLKQKTRLAIVEAGVVATYPIGFAVTAAVTQGGVVKRLANAVIWPVLALPYSNSSDHTIGGSHSKALLAVNNWVESAPR